MYMELSGRSKNRRNTQMKSCKQRSGFPHDRPKRADIFNIPRGLLISLWYSAQLRPPLAANTHWPWVLHLMVINASAPSCRNIRKSPRVLESPGRKPNNPAGYRESRCMELGIKTDRCIGHSYNLAPLSDAAFVTMTFCQITRTTPSQDIYCKECAMPSNMHIITWDLYVIHCC
jgi:hypothetical protein